MKILAIEKEINQVAESDYRPFLEDEAKKVWELQQEGMIREIYFNDNHCAVLILEADNKAYARLIINQLPLVQNKLIDFELMELTAYSGFARLFKK